MILFYNKNNKFEYVIKLIDFGIAKKVEQSTRL